jgi:NIPSNAP
MNRRSFIGGIASMAAAAPPDTPRRKTNLYLIENYYLTFGTQQPRINEFMSKGYLPAASSTQPVIFLEALVAPHMPQFMVIQGLESAEELSTMRARMRANPVFQKAFAAWESGAEPPYENYTMTLVKATNYASDISLAPPKEGVTRVFELRTYHSPTWRQLAALHRRFAGPEIQIFHRVGVFPILYSETVIGANMPNLTYLIPFDSLDAREKAWNKFGADPQWVKVRQESIDKDGQLNMVNQISLWRATPYSPVR